jgi:broad specificity phosphatase PhoE
MEIVTQIYRVNPAAVRPLRRQVIDAILNSLSNANRRQAFAAAELLEHALRYPDGPSDQLPSELKLAAWREEFQDTLRRLNAVLDRHPLPAPVLYRVARSVARFSFHSKRRNPNAVLAPAAAAVLVRLDRDLPTRLCRHLMDGYGDHTWNLDERDHGRLHQRLADDLKLQQPDSNALMQEINAAMGEIATYSPKDLQRQATPFLATLLTHQQHQAWALLALQRSDPSAPLAAFAPHALAILLSTAPVKAHAWIEDSPTQDHNHRRLIAAAYAHVGCEERALLPQDRAWLEQLFCSDDPETLSQLPRIVQRLVGSEPQLAIDLITSAHPDLLSSTNQRTHATAEILLWLGNEEHGIPLEQISPADAERLLRLLQAPANLDDHHFRDLLKRFAPRWPELVVNLAKTRLERRLQQQEHLSLPLWHQHHPSDSLDLLELPQGSSLLAECLDWGLPRADQAAFRAAWANIVACLFGWREPRLTTTLWSWWQDAPQPRLAPLQLLAALLAWAPERFPLEQHAFVGELLLSAASVDRTSSDWLVQGLAAAVRRPMRRRAFGEPSPEDVAVVAEAQQLHDRLPPCHPARRLYALIGNQAHEAIATAEEDDRALVEG